MQLGYTLDFWQTEYIKTYYYINKHDNVAYMYSIFRKSDTLKQCIILLYRVYEHFRHILPSVTNNFLRTHLLSRHSRMPGLHFYCTRAVLRSSKPCPSGKTNSIIKLHFI